MLDDELKNIWNASSQQERVKLDKALLLQDVDTQLHKLERGIKFRNALEIGVAVFMLPMFLIVAILVPFIYTKIGSVIIMVFCALVIYKLRKVRKYKPTELAKPLKEYLLDQRLYMYKEMQLLASVAYWYLAPFLVGFTLFMLGFSEIGFASLAIKIAGGLLLCVIIYYLNKREVDRTFKPLLEKLDKTIASLQQ